MISLECRLWINGHTVTCGKRIIWWVRQKKVNFTVSDICKVCIMLKKDSTHVAPFSYWTICQINSGEWFFFTFHACVSLCAVCVRLCACCSLSVFSELGLHVGHLTLMSLCQKYAGKLIVFSIFKKCVIL